jgi:hypothetical protein
MPLEPDASAPAETTLVIPKRRRKIILHTLAYVVGGGILGLAYYKVVGCRSGACPITSNPYVSTLYGSLMGLVLGGFGR